MEELLFSIVELLFMMGLLLGYGIIAGVVGIIILVIIIAFKGE